MTWWAQKKEFDCFIIKHLAGEVIAIVLYRNLGKHFPSCNSYEWQIKYKLEYVEIEDELTKQSW